jgi:predicted  nucleic acid-binding Zn-ribbon protein
MSKALTKKDCPKFDRINRYSVSINSLRNQLKHASGIDELTMIASKIIDLENQIMIEKSTGYKQLEEEKKLIENRIKKLSKEIDKANDDLQRVGNTLEYRLNGYKKTLQNKVESLNEEYTEMLAYLSNTQ